jgi:hypothetical protein
MGTLKFVKVLDKQAIFTIRPTFKVKGMEISHVTIINVNGTDLIATPCDAEGNPIEGSWKYTAEGVTMESLHDLVIRLKKINNKERHA